MGLSGHANQPGQHVGGHPVAGHGSPGVHKHWDPRISAMVEEPDHFRVVQIPTTYVVANVNTDMTLRYRPIHFGASPVDVLEGDLAKRPKSIRIPCAHLDRPIIH